MRLGVNVTPHNAGAVAREAERLGYTTALVPEGIYDAISVLGYIAGQTERITLVSGVCAIPARTPVTAAMTATTLSTLSDGRFQLGFGVSNTHSTQNWYGTPFAQPLRRTREYIEVVRMALRGDEVRYRGEHYTVPLTDDDGSGFRIPPGNADIPIHLAAIGPRSLELAGEIADGWIGIFHSAEQVAHALPLVQAGRKRAGLTLDGFEVMQITPLAIGDDPRALAEPLKPYIARFLSLGHRENNVYYRLAAGMGLEADAQRVQDCYAVGDAKGAAAAVPFEFVDASSLLGPLDRIVDRIKAFAAAGVTTLCVGSISPSFPDQVETLRAATTAMEAAGV